MVKIFYNVFLNFQLDVIGYSYRLCENIIRRDQVKRKRQKGSNTNYCIILYIVIFVLFYKHLKIINIGI